jgi:hypothetical protein
MAFTRDWNEATPLGSADANTLDDIIRNGEVDISDRLKNMIYGFIAGENTLAQHFQYLQFYQQGSDPSQPSADFARLWVKAVSSVSELMWRDDVNAAAQLTTGGKLNGAVLADDSVDNDALANIAQGSVKVGGASNAPTDLDASTDAQILVGDGTDINSVAMSGDITIDNAGATTIGAGKIDPGMMAAGSAYRADGSTVFNTSMAAADTFEDLDLSSYVGANEALVFLEIVGSTDTWVGRPKGYGSGTFANHVPANDSGFGVCSVNFGTTLTYGYIICGTDSSGIMQHGSNSDSRTFTIKLIGYIK